MNSGTTYETFTPMRCKINEIMNTTTIPIIILDNALFIWNSFQNQSLFYKMARLLRYDLK